MKDMAVKILVKYRYLFLIYFILAFLLFSKIIFSAGSISGGDWGFPDNIDQLKLFISSLGYSWSHVSNIFGARQISPTLVIFLWPVYLLARAGLPVYLAIKILLLVIFALAGSNMNLFLRYIGVRPAAAFVSGIIFFLTPIFFNYSLMGWIYVLVALALLPLFLTIFLKAVDKENFRYVFLSSLVFSIAILQSQAIIWYPLALIFVVIFYCKGSKQYRIGIKYFFLAMISFLVLNLYWLPSLLLLPDQGITGSGLVWASDSVGTSMRLSASNILKLWGSLFNYQFEISYPKILAPVSYVIPLLAFSSLFFWQKFRRHIGYLLTIFLTLALLYSIDRSIIARLPFSNLIRDTARFTMLSTFALTAMAGIALDGIFVLKKKFLPIAVVLLIFLNSCPFWSGKLFSGRTYDVDFRFRTKAWPPEYAALNAKIAQDKTIDRALFTPIGGRLSLASDQRFNGAFSEIVDVYGNYSPKPSIIYITSRGEDASTELISQISEAIKDQDMARLEFLMRLSSVDLLAMRKDMEFPGWSQEKVTNFESSLKALAIAGKADIFFDDGAIFAIRLKADQKPLWAVSEVVGVKSNYEKILNRFIDKNVLGKDDFLQIGTLADLKSLYGDDIALTFDDQNLTYSKHAVSNPVVYQFFPLQHFEGKVAMTIWWLQTKNKDAALSDRIRARNELAIAQLKKVNVGTETKGKYFIYTDKEEPNATVYVKINTICPTIVINDSVREIDCRLNQIKAIADIKLNNGLNIFKIDGDAEPLFATITSPPVAKPSPKIKYSQISPTNYTINIEDISDDFNLIFNDNFNSYWQVTDGKGLFSSQIVKANDHYVSDGYGNGYKIRLNDLQKFGLLKKEADGTFSAKIRLEYLSQKYFIFGLILSLAGLLAIILTLALSLRRRR